MKCRPCLLNRHSATLLSQKLVIFGGQKSAAYLNDLHVLDLGKDFCVCAEDQKNVCVWLFSSEWRIHGVHSCEECQHAAVASRVSAKLINIDKCHWCCHLGLIFLGFWIEKKCISGLISTHIFVGISYIFSSDLKLLNANRFHAALPVSDNRILVSGGCSAVGALQDLHIFNMGLWWYFINNSLFHSMFLIQLGQWRMTVFFLDTCMWSSVASPLLCSKPRAGHSMIDLGSRNLTGVKGNTQHGNLNLLCTVLVFGGSDCSGTFYDDTVKCTVEISVDKWSFQMEADLCEMKNCFIWILNEFLLFLRRGESCNPWGFAVCITNLTPGCFTYVFYFLYMYLWMIKHCDKLLIYMTKSCCWGLLFIKCWISQFRLCLKISRCIWLMRRVAHFEGFKLK